MRMKLGTLRKLLKENLDQMKLGIAGRMGGIADSEQENERLGTQGQGFLDHDPPVSFDPGDEGREFNRYRQEYEYDMSGDPIVDDTVPSLPVDGEEETEPDLQTVVSKRYAG